MAGYIGIDLGTTFSSIATLDESGMPVIIPNDSLKEAPTGDLTASCIMATSKKIVVGDQARRALQISNNAIGRFKRDMGTSKKYHLGEKECTPQDLSSILLSRLREIGEKKLGNISKAVVTIPANFSNSARAATLAAAKEAGLDIDHIINEPTSAALYYAYSENISNGRYAIFDLGGGTFDISIIEVKGTEIDVITSNGIQKLGGDDFDRELQKFVLEKFKTEFQKEITEEDYTLNDAEMDKITLSRKTKTIAGGETLDDEILQITRKDFENAIDIMLSQIELTCNATLDEAKVKTSEINDVVLVGGSSRLPCVSEVVEKVFKKKPVLIDKIDEAVSLGAALYAAYKSDGADLSSLQKEGVNKLNVGDCANHCFGTTAVDAQSNQIYNSIIIEKNTKIPCEISKDYATIFDNQKAIDCQVNQSIEATTDVDFVDVLWKGSLQLPEGRPAGQKITVTFAYDDNQTMSCTFLDVSSGKKVTKEIPIDQESEVEDILIE